MIQRFALAAILLVAGCASTNSETILNPDPPTGMETIELPGAQEISGENISILPPDEPESAGKLVCGDQITIQVYDQPSLSMELRIPQSGKISYPVIGELQIAGKTIGEIEADLKKRLEAQILNNAQVTVLVKSYIKRSVFVLGSIKKPGSFEIPFGKNLSMLQAISMAGGFSTDADKESILLLREYSGKRQVFQISYSEIIGKTGSEKTVNLSDGDVLIIKEQGKVYVLGRVNAPGGFSLLADKKMTLTKVISLAKGFDALAAQGRTTVIRSLSDGTTRIFRIDVGQIFSGKLCDPIMLPGDMVYVPESFF